jgi:hypothetical protein
MKINKANANSKYTATRHTQNTTAGHPEGTKPKLGVDIRAAEEERDTLCM